jgi:hypothetical protein
LALQSPVVFVGGHPAVTNTGIHFIVID